jgi:hypothetical protein
MTKKNVNDQKQEGFKKYLNFLPEYGILIFSIFMLVAAVTVVFFPEKTHGYTGWLSHNQHAFEDNTDLRYTMHEFDRIYISYDGTVYYCPEELLLGKSVDEKVNKLGPEYVRVTFICDPEIPFHKVQSVFDKLRKVNIRHIFLPDEKKISIIDIWNETQERRKI